MTEPQAEKRIDQTQEGQQEANQLDKPPDAAKVRNATASDKQAAFDSNKQIFRSITDVLAIPDGATYEEAKARQIAFEQKPVESFGICFEDGSVETVKGIEPARQQENREQIAIRDDYLNRERQKPTPHDGQTLSLKQLFEDYKTPFMDAYEHSKNLKDGQPGKSKTLEEIVDRLKDCPWADKVRIQFQVHPQNPEYSNLKSTITIDLADSPERQVEVFAHEAFHATHQFLSRQYDHGKLAENVFVNMWLAGEVESMLTETKVHQELGHSGERPKFRYVQNGEVRPIDIEDYVNKHGKEGFVELLRTVQPTGQHSEPYGHHYAKSYQDYVRLFDQNKAPVESYIQNWVKSGHQRDDI